MFSLWAEGIYRVEVANGHLSYHEERDSLRELLKQRDNTLANSAQRRIPNPEMSYKDALEMGNFPE
mgnify:CR=1 FL=1